jgi:hypothetical protein
MRVTVNPDEALVKLAEKLTGIKDRARLFEEGLRAIIESPAKSGVSANAKPTRRRQPK